MSAYPASFPIAESIELVKLVREGKVAEQKSLFAYDLWLVQGFVQKAALGEPGAAALAAEPTLTPAAVPADFDAVAELEKFNGAVAAVGADGVTPQFAVPWVAILQWALPELLKILAQS